MDKHWTRLSNRIFILVTIIFIVSASQALAAEAYQEALVTDYRGQVVVKKAGGEKTFPVFNGIDLGQGDTVITDNNSWVSLQIANDINIKIDKNSQINITQLITSLGNEKIIFNLWSGKGWFNIKRKLTKGSKFEIITPKIVVGARGTRFWLNVTKANHIALGVQEGSVTVNSASTVEQSSGINGELIIEQNQEMVFDGGIPEIRTNGKRDSKGTTNNKDDEGSGGDGGQGKDSAENNEENSPEPVEIVVSIDGKEAFTFEDEQEIINERVLPIGTHGFEFTMTKAGNGLAGKTIELNSFQDNYRLATDDSGIAQLSNVYLTEGIYHILADGQLIGRIYCVRENYGVIKIKVLKNSVIKPIKKVVINDYGVEYEGNGPIIQTIALTAPFEYQLKELIVDQETVVLPTVELISLESYSVYNYTVEATD